VQRSIFLARLIGPSFIVIALGLLLNQDAYRAVIDETPRSRALMYLSWLLSRAGGIATVNAHP
jgi:hypothetical protein